MFLFYFCFIWTICNAVEELLNLKFVGLTVFFVCFSLKMFSCLLRGLVAQSAVLAGSPWCTFTKFFAIRLSSELALVLHFLVDQFSFGCHLTLGPLVMFCPQTGALWQWFAWL